MAGPQDDQDNDDADADDIYMPEQGANHEADDESSVGRPEEDDDGAPGSSPPRIPLLERS